MMVISLPNRKLDESSPSPLYYQLMELITDVIENGQYGPEYQLPSERELAEKFGISRMTVRQATVALVNNGTLVRKRGKGTFVSPPKVEQGLLSLTSFTEDMENRGMTPSTRILSMKNVLPSENTARALDINVVDKIILLERLRMANGLPMAYERCHLSYQLFPGLTETDIKDRSLYGILREDFGITLTRARQTVEATLATAKEADLLHVKKGGPLLLFERVTLDSNDRVVEFVKSVYRADRYKFFVEMNAQRKEDI